MHEVPSAVHCISRWIKRRAFALSRCQHTRSQRTAGNLRRGVEARSGGGRYSSNSTCTCNKGGKLGVHKCLMPDPKHRARSCAPSYTARVRVPVHVGWGGKKTADFGSKHCECWLGVFGAAVRGSDDVQSSSLTALRAPGRCCRAVDKRCQHHLRVGEVSRAVRSNVFIVERVSCISIIPSERSNQFPLQKRICPASSQRP